MKYFCNPVNINYRYQFNMDPREGALKVAREAGRPVHDLFQRKVLYFRIDELKCLGVRRSGSLGESSSAGEPSAV